MPTISIGQLRQNPTAMIRAVKAGATYTLTDRGEPIADISPHRPERWRTGAEATAILAELGPDPKWLADYMATRSEEEPRDPWTSR